MNCPVDAAELVMSDRQGIEIDYCPQCRGVWLDRGELDKIIDRSATWSPDRTDRNDRDDRDDNRRPPKPDKPAKKKKGFLSEIFEFGE